MKNEEAMYWRVLIVCALLVPFGAWKFTECVVWILRHIEFGWKP